MILRLLAVLTVLIVIAYGTMDFSDVEKSGVKEEKSTDDGEKEKSLWFLRNASFLLAAGILFSYMGLENAVNGWFVTYLKSTGLMSVEMSTMMVSVTWLMIMAGRIVIAGISKNVKPARILAVISVMQFVSILLLVKAQSPAVVAAALMIMGLGMAGTFPTATAFTGNILGSSPLGMSVLTGIGSLGGILTPQIIGMLADRMGFGAAILFLVIDGLMLVICGVLTIPANNRRYS
jgi:fucose permease